MKTMGDVIKEHAKEAEISGNGGTDFGLRCLGLEDRSENYLAANLYISALSIIAKELGFKKEE